MKNTLLYTVTLLVLLAFTSCAGSRKAAIAPDADMSRELRAAGENVLLYNAKESESIAKAVARTYTPWQNVSLKGKASMDGLPLALSVKVYMVRTQSVIMSMNVPLLGEVGRVEIDPDSILLVNKRSKTFCKAAIAKPMSELGASITDLQDLLLGRVFVLGSGTLTEGNAPQVEVSTGASDTWIITPKVQPERAQYGFTLYKDGQMLMALAGTPDEAYMANALYTHNSDGYDIDLTFKFGGKSVKVFLDLDQPDFTPTPLEPISVNSKWKSLSFKSWIKSLTNK
ncbi:MAG: DUF4292 domain-containing protein [Prevotella sp.]|nr:DUF4292 domain-containing protein [Prevotella sp.]MCM1075418.1 DUF4292 domain-containing protein [Ruminococcus sp.]